MCAGRPASQTAYCDSQAMKENGRMSEPPDLKELEICATENYKYDFAQASQILQAMDFLRGQAMNTRIEEIVTMVDASFRILLTTYYCILRYEMQKLSPVDDMDDIVR